MFRAFVSIPGYLYEGVYATASVLQNRFLLFPFCGGSWPDKKEMLAIFGPYECVKREATAHRLACSDLGNASKPCWGCQFSEREGIRGCKRCPVECPK